MNNIEDLIERLRLGDGSSPDHALLIEASNALEHLLSELSKGLKNEEALQNELFALGVCSGGTRKNACNLGEAN
jgi:hypothetical protein